MLRSQIMITLLSSLRCASAEAPEQQSYALTEVEGIVSTGVKGYPVKRGKDGKNNAFDYNKNTTWKNGKLKPCWHEKLLVSFKLPVKRDSKVLKLKVSFSGGETDCKIDLECTCGMPVDCVGKGSKNISSINPQESGVIHATFTNNADESDEIVSFFVAVKGKNCTDPNNLTIEVSDEPTTNNTSPKKFEATVKCSTATSSIKMDSFPEWSSLSHKDKVNYGEVGRPRNHCFSTVSTTPSRAVMLITIVMALSVAGLVSLVIILWMTRKEERKGRRGKKV